MIVLSCCSINSLASNHSLPTGEVVDVDSAYSNVAKYDSVKIAYNDLRIVNSKLIELEYEKKVNINLRNIIHNDSIILKDCQELNKQITKQLELNNKKIKRQRNIAIITSSIFFITSVVLLVK